MYPSERETKGTTERSVCFISWYFLRYWWWLQTKIYEKRTDFQLSNNQLPIFVAIRYRRWFKLNWTCVWGLRSLNTNIVVWYVLFPFETCLLSVNSRAACTAGKDYPVAAPVLAPLSRDLLSINRYPDLSLPILFERFEQQNTNVALIYHWQS